MISLYAKGLTTGDIQAHLLEIYGTEISRETISKITDAIVEDMVVWQNRTGPWTHGRLHKESDSPSDGSVVITHRGRIATVLRGAKARDFLDKASSGDAQGLMARATGNYKRGNERQARNHRRNRRG